MEISRFASGTYILKATAQEMLLLNNALNEICNGVDIPQFETRVGVSREFAEELLQQVGGSLGDVH